MHTPTEGSGLSGMTVTALTLECHLVSDFIGELVVYTLLSMDRLFLTRSVVELPPENQSGRVPYIHVASWRKSRI